MSSKPVICFGQQPCGFFPKNFLVAKIRTARRLQAELGGEVVFFCHDSDHDPRETRTTLRHRTTSEPALLNFSFANRLQRKFSPQYLKHIPDDWQPRTLLQLPNYVERPAIELFEKVRARDVATFCLDMYAGMGLLEGVRVLRSSDPAFRRAACDIPEFFVDVPYEGETVRARFHQGALQLHEGGDSFITLPAPAFNKEQLSPTRDTRLLWMQSVIHCTHYVAGASEQYYLQREQTPEITFIARDPIDRSEEAFAQCKV